MKETVEAKTMDGKTKKYHLKLFDPKTHIGRADNRNEPEIRNVLELKRFEQRKQNVQDKTMLMSKFDYAEKEIIDKTVVRMPFIDKIKPKSHAVNRIINEDCRASANTPTPILTPIE